ALSRSEVSRLAPTLPGADVTVRGRYARRMASTASGTRTRPLDALVDRLLTEHDPADEVTFRGAQYDLGLAWVWFPLGFGGLGEAPDLQRHVDSRVHAAGARSDAVSRNGFGVFLAAPTIAAHGSDELKARLLRPL